MVRKKSEETHCVDTVIDEFQYRAKINFKSIVVFYRTVQIVLRRPPKIDGIEIMVVTQKHSLEGRFEATLKICFSEFLWYQESDAGNQTEKKSLVWFATS